MDENENKNPQSQEENSEKTQLKHYIEHLIENSEEINKALNEMVELTDVLDIEHVEEVKEVKSNEEISSEEPIDVIEILNNIDDIMNNKSIDADKSETTIEKEPDPVLVQRDTDIEKLALIKEYFPGKKDGGLTYTMMLSVLAMKDAGDVDFKPTDLLMYQEYLDIDNIIKLYKSRRDFPTRVRYYIKEYLRYLPNFQESAPKQSAETINSHYVRARNSKYFLTKLYQEDLLEEFYKHMYYDYIDLKNDFQTKELIDYSENAIEGVSWLNPETIEKLLEETNYDNESYKSFLKKLLDPSVYKKPKLETPSEVIFTELENKFPNFKEVTQYYKAQFRLNRMTQKERVPPVLLLGEPGIGKTHFAQMFAKALNTGYTFIDLASATDAWILSGLHASWRSGKPGKLFNSMMNSKTLSPVVLMDEIEKAPKGHHDSTTPLYQLLEETNAKEFVDEFIDFPADLSHIIVIACANSVEGLSEPLQSRFRIFNIPNPTLEQHAVIINSIYHEETSNSSLFEENLSEDVVDLLSTYSIREAKVKITEAVGKALLEFNEEQLEEIKQGQYKIKIEPKHIVEVKINKKKIGF